MREGGRREVEEKERQKCSQGVLTWSVREVEVQTRAGRAQTKLSIPWDWQLCGRTRCPGDP